MSAKHHVGRQLSNSVEVLMHFTARITSVLANRLRMLLKRRKKLMRPHEIKVGHFSCVINVYLMKKASLTMLYYLSAMQ